MTTPRPVFLDLLRIKLPLSGIVSILHRVSGVLMVLTIPIVAILFHQALSSPEGFAATAAVLDTWLTKLVLLGLLWALFHHLVAGIRHLFLDYGVGLDRAQARQTARLTLYAAPVLLALSIILSFLLGD